MRTGRRLFFSILLILILCLSVSAALAAFQYCPYCGKDLENKEYAFCPYCGKQLDTSGSGGVTTTLGGNGSISARVFEVSETVRMSHGGATITWTDSANAAPYYVAYRYADGNESDQVWYWAGGDEASSKAGSTSFTCYNLVPGHAYDISVADSSGKEIVGRVNVPGAPEFVDGKLKAAALKVKLAPRYFSRSAYDVTKAKSLNKFVSRQMDFASNCYGLRLEIGHPQLGKERHYPALLAFYAPNSYCWSFYDEDFNMATFANGGSTYYYCVGSFFFDTLHDKYGSVPRGSYRVEVYFDGMYVGQNSFSVE